VATGPALVRISPSGSITKLADAPAGALWLAVAIAPSGELIIGDGRRAALWSVAQDGSSVNKVATFESVDGLDYELGRGIGVVAAERGDYLVLIDAVDHSRKFGSKTRLLRVSTAGQVTEIRLSGVETWQASGAVQAKGGDVYFTAREDSRQARTREVYSVTSNGEVSRVAGADRCDAHALGAPPTGDNVVVVSPFCGTLLAVGPENQLVELLPRHIAAPIAVLVDAAR
jgi:hypothetical protein